MSLRIARSIGPAFRFGAVVVWAMLVESSGALAATDAMRDAIKQRLPKYDPEVRKLHLATLQAKEMSVSIESGAERAAETKDASALETSGELLTLPDLTVRAQSGVKGDAMLQLPRMVVRPRDEKEKADAFETGAARDARLVKKHLSVFDRMFLNRFNLFGASKEKRAREAEAIERSAQQLNEVAEALELRQLEQGETEADRELRKIYLDTFLSRPK